MTVDTWTRGAALLVFSCVGIGCIYWIYVSTKHVACYVYAYSSLWIVKVTSFRLVSPATTGSMVCWVFIAKHFLLRHVISLPVWSDFL